MPGALFSADLIIYNARIFDPVDGFRRESAVAVSRGKIILISSDHDINHLKGPDTVSFDAGGKLLMPALTDAHTHFLGYVRRKTEVDLSSCRTLPETLQVIREAVKKAPAGSWVTGGGWNHNRWGEDEFPHRQLLDAISTRHFIALESKDWHTHWVNTPVLKRAGISPDQPYHGAKHLAVHPKTGEFTGILEENTRQVIFDLIPAWDYQRSRTNFQKITGDFYRLGLTGIHSVETANEFRIYQQARREKELGLRVSWYLPLAHLSRIRDIGIEQGVGDSFLQIAGVKLFVDGAFGSQTAELFEDYDQLGHSGVETMTPQALNDAVERAVSARLSCAIHAIGDRAVHKALTALGRHHQESRKYFLRHRIEHAQLIRREDLPLFHQYRIFASVQPLHLAADIPIINKYLSNRAALSYPLADLKNAGACLLFGSDMPIEDFNPWHAIYTAMERKQDIDPQQPTFYPDQQLDLTTCLQAYTIHPARAVGRETEAGRILPGWNADMFVLDRDIFGIPPAELKDCHAVLTLLDGQVVHQEIL